MPTHPRPRFQIGDWAFTWDPAKAKSNLDDHDVSFFEAANSFLDPYGLDDVDRRNPPREKLTAYSAEQRLLLTVYIEVEGPIIRIIIARPATRAERQAYEQNRVEEPDGHLRRLNPYAAALDRVGVRVLASALPREARSFESWAARHARPSRAMRRART